MPTTRDEIDEFHRFAVDHLAQSEDDLELDDLVQFWHDLRQRDEVNEVIRQGLRDMEQGLGRPAGEVAADLHRKFGQLGG